MVLGGITVINSFSYLLIPYMFRSVHKLSIKNDKTNVKNEKEKDHKTVEDIN